MKEITYIGCSFDYCHLRDTTQVLLNFRLRRNVNNFQFVYTCNNQIKRGGAILLLQYYWDISKVFVK